MDISILFSNHVIIFLEMLLIAAMVYFIHKLRAEKKRVEQYHFEKEQQQNERQLEKKLANHKRG